MDRDRRLAEMTGMWDDIDGHTVCPNFSTPEWRARLMDWATEQEWWGDFLWSKWSAWAPTVKNVTRGDFVAYLWRNLATLLVEYHGEGR